MNVRWPVLFVATLLCACRVVSSREVTLPTAGPVYRVECHYELGNCLKDAERRCGRALYEQITRQNCPRCGLTVPPSPDKPESVTRPGYYGVIYYRCID